MSRTFLYLFICFFFPFRFPSDGSRFTQLADIFIIRVRMQTAPSHNRELLICLNIRLTLNFCSVSFVFLTFECDGAAQLPLQLSRATFSLAVHQHVRSSRGRRARGSGPTPSLRSIRSHSCSDTSKILSFFFFFFFFPVAQRFQCREQRCNQALRLLPSNPRIL